MKTDARVNTNGCMGCMGIVAGLNYFPAGVPNTDQGNKNLLNSTIVLDLLLVIFILLLIMF
jgi:hypothetical protein